jgi:hypothetical protein
MILFNVGDSPTEGQELAARPIANDFYEPQSRDRCFAHALGMQCLKQGPLMAGHKPVPFS